MFLHRLYYCDVIMTATASQIISLTTVYSTVYSGADHRKHQSSASLVSVRGIHRSPVNCPHKRPCSTAEIATIWWRHHVHIAGDNIYSILAQKEVFNFGELTHKVVLIQKFCDELATNRGWTSSVDISSLTLESCHDATLDNSRFSVTRSSEGLNWIDIDWGGSINLW